MSVGPYSTTLERFEAINFCGYIQGDYTPETQPLVTDKPESAEDIEAVAVEASRRHGRKLCRAAAEILR